MAAPGTPCISERRKTPPAIAKIQYAKVGVRQKNRGNCLYGINHSAVKMNLFCWGQFQSNNKSELGLWRHWPPSTVSIWLSQAWACERGSSRLTCQFVPWRDLVSQRIGVTTYNSLTSPSNFQAPTLYHHTRGKYDGVYHKCCCYHRYPMFSWPNSHLRPGVKSGTFPL